ncbi:hypothetical protein CC85DRAFT_314251 [Cutaneotrichosporon oleaginosum]|uniref:mRNA decay factor PAT1 domain-containing protein n=1 Tax=Cutaneotrichosporon oleaginosum TaxID=879819 RepID=A0A0J0XCF2_9TREE|nr:uncharacterized protein CC85DRAFT_314251 [Cutaneotrichosporon oleaginosum]KLT38758.1 hypothetical protein CC85DRAFT_314251 [Cutaneotrichosporon oleaginosum]TXT11521.1 hypothetical protein COLE_01931 [Cutaneotrichosporon oleaginosum]
MSFFGFDTALPDDPRAKGPGFHAHANTDAFNLGGAGVEEDLAVYQWGEGDASLLEGGDELNDETFGDFDDIAADFNFSAAPAPSKPRVASTKSHFGPKAVADPFAMTEDDFYSSSSRPAPKKAQKAKKKEPEPAWARASPANAWGAQRPPQHIPSIDEIEAGMAAARVSDKRASQPKQVFSLEEIERQLVSAPQPQTAAVPVPGHQRNVSQHQQMPMGTPPAHPTPPPQGNYNPQAVLDSMFPDMRQAQQGHAPPPPGMGPSPVPTMPSALRDKTPEQLAAIEARIAAKIESMSKFNNLMGNSDKDFITRIQLSQLATSDPYTSDFYAQVFSALKRQQGPEGPKGPNIVQAAPGMGFGVGGPANRFGKMGNASMQRLATQVRKLVASSSKRQANMSNDALQGALGRVPARRGAQATPRPVLNVGNSKADRHRPMQQLNTSSETRPALTRKQVMFALEELYDQALDIEQLRRDAPPPTDVPRVEAWSQACNAKVEEMWRTLMVMEPLGVSTPHPFISLLNPLKGQRLFPRLLRHLPSNESLTLLTLLVATYPQLDVVARAPPPPVADASLLTKADRLDRARREAETDSFLQYVVPGVDTLINQCGLGLISGLLGICSQRMDIGQVAATRPGVALFTALLSRAQSLLRAPPEHSPTAEEVDHWNKTFAYFLFHMVPHLNGVFPSSVAQKAAFGPGAYLLDPASQLEGVELERREAEAWGFAAALAVNAPEDRQTELVGALRDKILHAVQAARDPHTNRARAELKLRNVNMFLHGLGLDASMIE